MPNAELAPAPAAASRMRSISGSLMNGNDRRDAHADRHAGARERLDRADAPVRRRGARLEDARERRVERRHRDVDRHQAALAHRRDEVEIALDARRFGDQRERVSAFGKNLDHRARDAELALHRLVGIGRRADVDRARPVRTRRELLAQPLRGVDLGDDLGFEVEAGRQAEVAVRRSREAVDAAVLAASIGVDRQVEAEVRRVVLGEDRLDAFLDDRRLGAEALLGGFLVERSPAVVVALARLARIAVLDRPDRAPALGRHAPGVLGARRLVARDRALPFGR